MLDIVFYNFSIFLQTETTSSSAAAQDPGNASQVKSEVKAEKEEEGEQDSEQDDPTGWSILTVFPNGSNFEAYKTLFNNLLVMSFTKHFVRLIRSRS